MNHSDTVINSVENRGDLNGNGPLLNNESIWNKKIANYSIARIAVCATLFISISVIFYFINRYAVENATNAFNQAGISQVNHLASKISTYLLEKDILALQGVINEVAKEESLRFIAIVDHEKRILGHTDPDMLNQTFDEEKNYTRLSGKEKVVLYRFEEKEKGPVRIFKSDIDFSDVKIGQIFLAVSENQISATQKRYDLYFIAEALIAFIFSILVLLLANKKGLSKLSFSSHEFDDITQVVGSPYIMKKKIAQGGMSELFLADYVREGNFRRTVAVKRILPHLAENQSFIQMLAREARLAALLQHPNIVQIVDFGKIQNVYFLAMELIRGKDLARIMNVYNQGFPVDQTLYIFSQVCQGLQYSHEKTDDNTGKPLGIVHRDINPQNILISYAGEVKITDFGISKAGAETSLTRAGDIKGKISYLSPEQALGKDVDHQADLYALGVTIYEVLSGKRLYKFESDIEAIRAIPELEIPAIKTLRPDVPNQLNDIVMKCLEKDKRKRYQSAKEIFDDLTATKNALSSLFDSRDLSNFMKNLFKDEIKENV